MFDCSCRFPGVFDLCSVSEYRQSFLLYGLPVILLQAGTSSFYLFALHLAGLTVLIFRIQFKLHFFRTDAVVVVRIIPLDADRHVYLKRIMRIDQCRGISVHHCISKQVAVDFFLAPAIADLHSIPVLRKIPDGSRPVFCLFQGDRFNLFPGL